ncbi:MAG: hypothetical protein PHD67_10030 [Oscillospiraceae bacterium]|nr:hypothetical protein [Oscillospiraceae bacterium]
MFVVSTLLLFCGCGAAAAVALLALWGIFSSRGGWRPPVYLALSLGYGLYGAACLLRQFRGVSCAMLPAPVLTALGAFLLLEVFFFRDLFRLLSRKEEGAL